MNYQRFSEHYENNNNSYSAILNNKETSQFIDHLKKFENPIKVSNRNNYNGSTKIKYKNSLENQSTTKLKFNEKPTKSEKDIKFKPNEEFKEKDSDSELKKNSKINEKSTKDEKNEKFAQNSLNYLIQKKKQVGYKRNSENYETIEMGSPGGKELVYCNFKSNEEFFDEVREEEASEKTKNLPHRKNLPKPILIESKPSSFQSKKSPSSVFNTIEPISPNRSILFYDFLKTKFGESKFSEIMAIIEKYQSDEAKEKTITIEDYEKMKGIIGEADTVYIVKFLRFILKLTPKGNTGKLKDNFDFALSIKECLNSQNSIIDLRSPNKK